MWLLSLLFVSSLVSLDSVSLIIVFIIRRHHIAIDTTLRSTSYPTTPFQVDRGLFLLLSDCLPSRACTISFLVSSVNAGLLLHFHCHLYHILAPSRFEDLSILSEGNVGPTYIHQHLTKTSIQPHSCRHCAFPVRHHLTLFHHPRESGHRLLSACPGPSISERTSFYSAIICTETALAVNFASSILAPVSFSPLSQSYVLIYPLFPTLIAPITAHFMTSLFFLFFAFTQHLFDQR